MKPETLLEILDAAHISAHVESPFEQRGGLMIVGPPGVMKTTFLKAAFDDYPNALVLSDLNVQTATAMRDDFISGRYRTLAFVDYEKLYKRHSSTASNLEGVISGLVEEGFTRTSFEDQRMSIPSARVFVAGAMTHAFYTKKFRDWLDSGFSRRFLWVSVRLQNPDKIVSAIHDWEKISIGDTVLRRDPKMPIKYNLSGEESMRLRNFVKEQPGQATPFVLLKKIAVCLKWKYKDDIKRVNRVLQDFAPCLTKQGATIEL